MTSEEYMYVNVRDYAVSVLASLSEEKMYEFVQLFGDEGTLARIDSDIIAHNPNAKRYKNFKEFMKDMENEIDA